jgi:hypothetical protein
MKRFPTPLSRAAASLAFALVLLVAAGAAPTAAGARHVQVRFQAVGDSGVSGIADLRQRPHAGGTRITVVAFGLKPGGQYLSLYYDNHVCALEPYSVDDVIGGIYTANSVGVGTTHGTAEDNLADINSVSVRKADFTLVACADVHPGG